MNGFIGTGGGIILYFTLKFLKKLENNNTDIDMKNNMAMVISAVIPMSLISSVIYMAKGNVKYNELLLYIPAALAGGIIGAFLLDKLKFEIVKKLFAVMIIYSGIRMILK